MHLKLGFALALCAAVGLSGCGRGTLIGSGPVPTSTPTTPSVTAEYAIPVASSAPGGMGVAANSFLYIAQNASSQIAAISYLGGTVNEYATETASAGPGGLTIGPDGNPWFTESAADKIGTFNNSKVTEYSVSAGAAPAEISKGAGSNVLYFTEPGLNAVGWITTLGASGGPFTIPSANAQPLGITGGPGLYVYFTEYNAAKIGRFNPTANRVDAEFPLPAGSAFPDQIIQGPDGNIWFTEDNPAAPKIATMTQSGVITEFPLTGAKSATALVFGQDNNLYFLDPVNNAIGQFIVNTQTTSEFPIKTAGALSTNPLSPQSILVGPDGKLYFTEQAANQIGQFTYF